MNYKVFKELDIDYEADPEWVKAIEHMANLIREWVDREILKSIIKETGNK